jgi:hypothetical protein
MQDHRSTPLIACVTLVVAVAAVGCRRAQSEPASREYLGTKPPGAHAALFAPGIVSTGMDERDIAMTPYGQEIYWGVSSPGHGFATIMVSRRTDATDSGWTIPRVAAHMTDPSVLHIEPALSADGKQMFFTVVRPDAAGGFGDSDIWVMARVKTGWAAPAPLGPTVNTDGGEFFASPTRSGTLYFTREPRDGRNAGIYRSRLVDGKYAEAERLPVQVNAGTGRFNAFVDRDERYLIVPMQGMPDSLGGVDYYVVFRNDDDTWSEPVNMGPEVNTAGSQEYSPYVSPGGKYFFFMSSRRETARPKTLTYKFFGDLMGRPRNGNSDIWWIDAGFIEKLRPVPSVRREAVLEIESPQSRHK